jgi:hypothetical protein
MPYASCVTANQPFLRPSSTELALTRVRYRPRSRRIVITTRAQLRARSRVETDHIDAGRSLIDKHQSRRIKKETLLPKPVPPRSRHVRSVHACERSRWDPRHRQGDSGLLPECCAPALCLAHRLLDLASKVPEDRVRRAHPLRSSRRGGIILYVPSMIEFKIKRC